MELDQELMAQFANGSDEAFGALVERYWPLVDGAARRQVGNGSAADDVVQAVFIVLARKAPQLRGPLAGWLLQTTRYCAANAERMKRRRGFHERKAASMRSEAHIPQTYEEVAPFLDEALGELRMRDRDALALHYLQQRPVEEVSAALGLSEAACRKCLTRALERLRGVLAGVGGAGRAMDAGALAVTLAGAGGGGGAMSAAVARAVANAALAGSAKVAVTSGPVLIAKGAIEMMTMVKMQMAAGIAVAVMVTGFTSYGVLKPVFGVTAPTTAPAPQGDLVHGVVDPATGVELVAVGKESQGGVEWWTPGGEKSSFQAESDRKYGLMNSPDWLEVVLALRLPPSVRDETVWQGKPAVEGVDYLVMGFRPNVGQPHSWKLEYATGPWKKVNMPPSDLGRGFIAEKRFDVPTVRTMPFLNNHHISTVGMFQTATGVSMTVIDDAVEFQNGMERRDIAVDKQGHEHLAQGKVMDDQPKYTVRMVEFEKLQLADLQDVRHEIRPTDAWVEFSGMALETGAQTNPTVKSGRTVIAPAIAALPNAPGEEGKVVPEVP